MGKQQSQQIGVHTCSQKAVNEVTQAMAAQGLFHTNNGQRVGDRTAAVIVHSDGTAKCEVKLFMNAAGVVDGMSDAFFKGAREHQAHAGMTYASQD